MSRIGKKPVDIPEGVVVEVKGEELQVKGENATLTIPLLPGIRAEIKDSQVLFSPEDSTKQTMSNWGTIRSLTKNAVEGASGDFKKELIVEGVGYRASVEGNDLVLILGFSHPIRFRIPENIKISAEKNTIAISGADKALVGEVAAKIRSFRKPEPYKGKGIRYSDEVVRRKPGKKAVGAGEV